MHHVCVNKLTLILRKPQIHTGVNGVDIIAVSEREKYECFVTSDLPISKSDNTIFYHSALRCLHQA